MESFDVVVFGFWADFYYYLTTFCVALADLQLLLLVLFRVPIKTIVQTSFIELIILFPTHTNRHVHS